MRIITLVNSSPVQEKAFKLGCSWGVDGTKDIKYMDATFFKIEDKEMFLIPYGEYIEYPEYQMTTCDFLNLKEFEVKTHRPFNIKDSLEPLMGRFIKSKVTGNLQTILGIDFKDGCFYIGSEWYSFYIVMQEWEFTDRSPVGVCLENWKKGDKVRNKTSLNLVIFTKYSDDGIHFFHEENMKPLKISNYIKVSGDNVKKAIKEC